MSIDDRLALVEAIWTSIEADQDKLPVSDEQKAELDCRIAEMDANPAGGIAWDEAKARLRRRS
jgi:putative addiction module component (TIGR02574 family)